MKRLNHYLLAFFMLLICASCADEAESDFLTEMGKQKESYWSIDRSLPSNLQSINTYAKSRMAKSGQTRAVGAYAISPYVYEGDTVMYVVNYGDGWDIFSNDEHSRLVLFSSERGSIDLSDSTTYNPSLKSYIDATAEELLELKRLSQKEDIPVNPEWGYFQPILKAVPENTISVTERAALQNETELPGPGEDGEWVLLQVESVTTGSEVEHLTQTKWAQLYPWNVYCRAVNDGHFDGAYCPAGCAPVAVGQFMYYYHFLEGNPMYTITDVVINYDYLSFIGQSSYRWNQMAQTSQDPAINKDYVARYLRYLGYVLDSRYNENNTFTLPDTIESYMSDLGFPGHFQIFDFNVVKESLNSNRILLASAFLNSNFGYGHIFIIDGYVDKRTTTTKVYGWKGNDRNGNDTVDDGGDPDDISTYSYISTVVNTQNNKSVFMNWGQGGQNDDVACTPSVSSSWLNTYNGYKQIFY